MEAENYCGDCAKPVKAGVDKCPSCVKKQKTSGVFQSMPTLADLKVELASIINSNKTSLIVPNDIHAATVWWLKMQEPHRKHEAPKKMIIRTGNGWFWEWVYAERVKRNLIMFLALDSNYQNLIVSASEDDIFWRGDNRACFTSIINETFEFRKGSRNEYVAETLKQLGSLKGRVYG